MTFLFCFVLFLVARCKLLVEAYGIQLPDQGSNQGPLHWECRVLATGPPWKSVEATSLLTKWSQLVPRCPSLLLHLLHCRLQPSLNPTESRSWGQGLRRRETRISVSDSVALPCLGLSQFSSFYRIAKQAPKTSLLSNQVDYSLLFQ